MSITYERNGDGTGTLVLSITAEQTRFEEILYNYGEAVYETISGVALPYGSLTTQQQLNLIEKHIKQLAISKDRAMQELNALNSINKTTPDW